MGGNVTLDFQDLLSLQNNSEITSTAGQDNLPGDGGNIIILGEGLVFAFPDSDSDIQANSFNGQGGMISISVNQLLGLEFSDELTVNNDITAFSRNQPEFSGTVNLNIVRNDRQSRTIRLPDNLGDPSKLTQASCSAEDIAKDQNLESRLVLTERDFPSEPTEYRQSPLNRRFWISSTRAKQFFPDQNMTPQVETVSSHLPYQRGIRTAHCS
jgi:large exoprotein involved in heme utilization and adhesion